jgi:hypothetical protein
VISFERECRTPHSESYTILEEEGIIGRIDIHYQGENVYATLCTTADASDERIQELIDSADERLVMTAHPFRDDFIVTVWKGWSGGVYSDDEEDDDDEEEPGPDDTFRLN